MTADLLEEAREAYFAGQRALGNRNEYECRAAIDTLFVILRDAGLSPFPIRVIDYAGRALACLVLRLATGGLDTATKSFRALAGLCTAWHQTPAGVTESLFAAQGDVQRLDALLREKAGDATAGQAPNQPHVTLPVRGYRFWALALIIALLVCSDQLTKLWAINRLKGTPPITFLGDTIRIQYAENPGSFLGLGSGLSPAWRFILFSVLNAVVLCMLLYYLMTTAHVGQLHFIAFALVLSGGVGNTIDRLCRHGLVIDFLNLGIGPIRTGIFNLADVAITCGAFIMVWLFFTDSPQQQGAGRKSN